MKKNRIKNVSPAKGTRIKQPEVDIPSTDYLPPVFSLSNMNADYCITACDANDKVAFVHQIRLLSQLRWIDIKLAPRHGIGIEKIEKLNVPIPVYLKEDVKFIALRYNGKKAMVGYRELQVFHIIWVDRDYSVYDHS